MKAARDLCRLVWRVGGVEHACHRESGHDAAHRCHCAALLLPGKRGKG